MSNFFKKLNNVTLKFYIEFLAVSLLAIGGFGLGIYIIYALNTGLV